jgi:Eukaryotic aspartyl protease
MGKQMDKNSLLQSMLQAGAIERAAFAMCLSQTGGSLSFGGSGLARTDSKALENPEQYHLEPMYYSKLTQDHGLYALDVHSVYIGDYCITCDNTPDRRLNEEHAAIMAAFGSGKGTLLDSGTTDTYFPRAVEKLFAKIWEQKVGSKLVAKRMYTYEEFLRMPIVTVVFAPNATIHAHPCSYMEGVPMDLNATKPDVVQPWTGQRKLTIRLYTEEAEGAVLGANFMYNYDVLYDLAQNRVGFARAMCGFDRIAQARLNSFRDKAGAETQGDRRLSSQARRRSRYDKSIG